VYVFTKIGTTWKQQEYIKASNADTGDMFGYCIALSGDGDTLVVGAPEEKSKATGTNGNQDDNSLIFAGAVYVFRRTGAVWGQEAYVKASNTREIDLFGTSITLSDDGHTLAVGAPRESSGSILDPNDDSASDAGAVHMFIWTGLEWKQEGYLKSPRIRGGDSFGIVSLSGDASVLAVGASGENYGTTGVGNEPMGGAFNSGAVFLY